MPPSLRGGTYVMKTPFSLRKYQKISISLLSMNTFFNLKVAISIVQLLYHYMCSIIWLREKNIYYYHFILWKYIKLGRYPDSWTKGHDYIHKIHNKKQDFFFLFFTRVHFFFTRSKRKYKVLPGKTPFSSAELWMSPFLGWIIHWNMLHYTCTTSITHSYQDRMRFLLQRSLHSDTGSVLPYPGSHGNCRGGGGGREGGPASTPAPPVSPAPSRNRFSWKLLAPAKEGKEREREEGWETAFIVRRFWCKIGL